MASGNIEDSMDDLSRRRKVKWTENSKVYERRSHKKSRKATDTISPAPVIDLVVLTTTPTAVPVDPISVTSHLCDIHANAVTSTAVLESGCIDALQENAGAEVVTDDVVSLKQNVRVGSESQTAGPQDVHGSFSPHIDTVHSLKNTSRRDPVNTMMQSNGNGSVNLSEASALNSESNLLNGRSVEIAQRLVSNDLHHHGVLPGMPPHPPIGSDSSVANAVMNPLMISNVDDRVRFHLSHSTSKNEIEELRKDLEKQLDQVRKIVKQLEAKEIQLSLYKNQISDSNLNNNSKNVDSEVGNVGVYAISQPQNAKKDVVDRRVRLRINPASGVVQDPNARPRGLARVSSDVGTTRNLEPKAYCRQLSVAVMENNQRTGDLQEKEKRTPKANQYYRKSEFLLAKDRLPPESNRRQKTNKGRKHREGTEYAFGFGFGFEKRRNQAFKSCSSILQRLMKHSHGWVFNEPVNAKALVLHDYHDVIAHPMDLGTIKTRLSQKRYMSPREFAEDVRLVFRNAMTYNPKGHDVHFMAEQLSNIFEERWAILETEYNPYWKFRMYQDPGLYTPTYRKAVPHSYYIPVSALDPADVLGPPFVTSAVEGPTPSLRTLDRPDFVSTPLAADPVTQRQLVGRTPVPKKPKAKDPNKRDMTFDEKQRLSRNLESLPLEKLDLIVQMIKRQSSALSQHETEIEIDIDQIDTETLWELDRFVTNYKKSLSKNKRKANLALQARMAAQRPALMNTSIAAKEAQNENGTGAFNKNVAPLAVEGEKQGPSGSSSSSSSSDSGSSSSDSDSDSSSSDGSDDDNSPKT